jgi:hypothetical protein
MKRQADINGAIDVYDTRDQILTDERKVARKVAEANTIEERLASG